MKFLIALLLAFAMTANAYASAAQVRVCCPSVDCSVIECAEMGCLPAPNAVVPQTTPVLPAWASVRELAIEIATHLPKRYKPIWTPPD